MKAKDKAKQLYDKMKFETEFNSQPSTVNGMCKKLALICVDEIIINGGTKNVIQYEPNCFTNKVDYWKEVKQEIENI